MIGVIAVLKIKEGSEAQFEAGFKALAAKVKANEPGNLAYQLTKSRADPLTYKVLELYKDQDAPNTSRTDRLLQGRGRRGVCSCLGWSA